MTRAIGQKALFACLCLLVLAVPAAASTYYIPQLAVGKAGDLEIRTVVTLSNPSSNVENATIVLATCKDDGSPWVLDWEARDRPDVSGSSDFLQFALLPGGTATLLAKSTGPLAIGWMRGRTTVPIVLTVRYSVARRLTGGLFDPQWEVGVLPAAGLNEHYLFVAEGASDWSGCITSTALALANTAQVEATLTLELFPYGGGSPVQTRTLTIPANGHIARFLPEIFTNFFSADAFRGMVRISSNTAVAVTTLQNWVIGNDSVYAAASTVPFQAAASNVGFEEEPTEAFGQGEIVFLPAEIVGVLSSSSDGPDIDVFRMYVSAPATLGFVSLADIAGSGLSPQIGLYTEGGQVVVASGTNVLNAFGATAFQAAITQTGWYDLRVSSPASAHGRQLFYRIFVGIKR